ncbi:T9SS type A sorting domain-containing protein [Pontibacter arcticus]|uniref:Por secretion system C-terminal sorting domain-containing protein n=1 Tax=Pontibacter arcticus TaxID=2080288 RepID=A0A364RGG2_9BACT|nr:T9SS type A sorting domain-containing protein [Pontibacter arcticus]RAU83391.1 hypothetical protein DP923_09325 [Pontibacter arcticus]
MKKLYFLLLLTLVSLTSAFAQQTQLYAENFSSNNKEVVATPSGSWSRSSGSWRTQESKSVQTRAFDLTGISTEGYTDVSVSWAGYRSSQLRWLFIYYWEKNDYELELFYSINGGTAKKVTGWADNTNYNSWEVVNGGNRILLPKETSNVKNLKLTWRLKVGEEQYFAIDNITVTAKKPVMSPTLPGVELSGFEWSSRPAKENPFAVSGPQSATPYRLDGIAMRFSRTSDAGVNVTEALIGNDRFQSPKTSFSLVQTGATAVRGTTVRIDFEEPVSDLTFTLFDVDQGVRQFQDKIVVTGVAPDGKIVTATKENVKAASTQTKYTALSGEIISSSVYDIPSDSELGNTMVSFTEPVDQVNIAYYNGDAARGQQGIGMYNFYGRSNPAPLPVELISFKGKVQDIGTVLNWATAMEKNNDVFIVERSQDGENFAAHGQVKGSGNSSAKLSYSYTDATATPGIYYYRLQQVDLDGTVSFSKVISVELVGNPTSKNEKMAVVYPTIVNQDVNVNLHVARAQLLILDASGKTMATIESSSAANQTVSVSHLPGGAYFLVVNDGQRKETHRFLKQ